ncbi:MAG TPA: hypothetical protein PLD30_10080 [Candidatus Competibacteraceae bacterium]|nr:hypothetical protein [Candidatus Competibacteraceae bacterium]
MGRSHLAVATQSTPPPTPAANATVEAIPKEQQRFPLVMAMGTSQ